jgi:hypothetical protein
MIGQAFVSEVVTVVDDQIEDDDWPEFVVYMTNVGPNRASVFALLRQTLNLDPAATIRLLSSPRIEVARGPRMKIDTVVRQFREAGATVEVFSN